MHAQNRTMLAKLGFADPDKQDPQHDLVCQYLSLPENVQKLAHLLELDRGDETYTHRYDGETLEETGVRHRRVAGHGVTFERPISKGEDRYKTTIGFVDLLITFDLRTYCRERRERRRERMSCSWGPWKPRDNSEERRRVNVGVEVKVSRVQVGEVLRQLQLYRAFTDSSTPYRAPGWNDISNWVVATTYALSAAEANAIRNERILHVRLGDGFRQFVSAQRALSPVDSIEI